MIDIPLQRLRQPDEHHLKSTWKQARVPRIEKALALSQDRNPGGWHVVGASVALRGTSLIRHVLGREVVVWRAEDGTVHAGPGACPHMGAALADCVVDGSDVLCRWHGMALPREGGKTWLEFPAHDDGVLVWLQLPTEGEEPLDAPVIPQRPPVDASIPAVISIPATCEPRDIIANRLDPWHGAWFHPYAFSHLIVDDEASTDDRLVLEVAFRLNKTWGVPVTASFTTPSARCIVMHIIEGEGEGSVVETHATPLTGPDGRQRTMMTEATIAHSERTGFKLARGIGRLIVPMIQSTARRLWVDDLTYAERRYALRTGAVESPLR